MSSKKLIYFLVISLICGLVVGEAAHATIIGIKGTVSHADGSPVVGATVKAPGFGSLEVSSATNDEGFYRIPYISFANVVIQVGDEITVEVTDAEGNVIERTHSVTAADVSDGEATFNITFVSTTVTVTVSPNTFSAATASTGTITATVDLEGPVTDEIVTFALSPNVGTVSATTNNGDGTYTATYTSGRVAGEVTITGTATESNASGTATVSINAGPPAEIGLSAIPTTVSSGGRSIVTARVSDSNGNGVGGASLTGTSASGGTLTNFAPAATFGTYTATYTAPTVEADSTDTVTVMSGDLSQNLTLNLTPVPPRDVSILIVEGTVFKVDGEVPAEDVNVTVTVGSTPSPPTTTDENGNYSVTVVNLGGVAASTGDPVTAVVTDVTGTERGSANMALTNEQLGEGDSATVTLNVNTDIVIPPRAVSVLVVEGVVYSDDGVSPVENVDVTVTVTVGSNAPQTTTIDADGNYSVTAIDLLGTVAVTGDMVSTVVITDADGMERGRADMALTNTQLGEGDSATVTQNVMTDITLPPRSVNILVIEGVAYKEDMTTPVGEGLDVTVTVGANPPQMAETTSDGSFTTTILNLLGSAASSGDTVSIVVADGSGERGRDELVLGNVHLGKMDSATVSRQVATNIGLTTGLLAVEGIVYLKNGETQSVPAASHLREDDLTVVVTNTTRNLTTSRAVDDDGGYSVTFLDLLGTVAETGDSLTVEVQNEAGEVVGTMAHILTIPEVKASSAEVDVHTTVPAEIRAFNITGTVIEIDGSPAGPGLEVSLIIAINGHRSAAETVTDAAGGYEYTFVDLLNPVAATGDILMVDVLRQADQFHAHSGPIRLRSADLIDQMMTVGPITLVPPRLELGGLSINTAQSGFQESAFQSLFNIDLEAIAGAADIGSTNPLVALPPSLLLITAPLLSIIGSLQLELPMGFDLGDENIAQESFGNAITTRPTAWAVLPVEARQPGRWLNGEQLHLFLVGAPTIESVTFSLNGSQMSATSVPEGGSFPYTFQLEEEPIALFESHMPAFGAVQLMIDGQMPIDMTRNEAGIWEASAEIAPGSTVTYYYMVTLARPYHDPLTNLTVSSFPLIDPRNRQVMTGDLVAGLDALLMSGLQGDPGVRSAFTVPEVNYQQSVWVGRFDLSGMADGEYAVDTHVSYRGGHTESIDAKAFTLDRTAPTAAVALDLDNPGMNAGMYMREDGTYVATGPTPGAASLTVSADVITGGEDGALMYQLARMDDMGNLGTWNPVVTPSLLPLNLEALFTNPAGILPLTYGPDHQLQMLIRNSEGNALLGRYGLRAVGIDSLLNIDATRGAGVVVDLVLPDPDVIALTAVQSDFDGNGVIEGLESQSTASDFVVFSNSVVTLVADVMTRTDHPLASVALEFQVAGTGWQPIGMFTGDQLDGLGMGDQLTAVLPVPDIPLLPDRGGHVMVRVVTTNALNVVHESVVTAAYQRQLAPEISGIHTTVTDRHPDSNAPQGLLTVSAFTQAVSNPGATAVQFEVRRSADEDWMPLGIVQLANTTVTSHVQISIIEDLVNSIVSGAPSAPISLLYREWSHTFDSAMLPGGDTIMDNTRAASDVSLDDNPYVVRAIAVDAASTRYESAAGIEDRFSLDNYSPTAITTVANEVEMVMPREDGSYYVSGLIHESVPDPMLTLAARTGAHPNAFIGGIALAVNDGSGTAVEIPETAFTRSGTHTYTSAFNLASIPNGTYTFMAVAHAGDGAVEARIVAMAITVEVGNFTPPENFANPTVDILSVMNTQGDTHSPSEIDAQYPIGFPAIDEQVKVTLIVPNVAGGDVDVLIGEDRMSAAAMGGLMVMEPDADNNIMIMVDTAGLGEGMYGLVGTVTKPNGSVAFGLPAIRVDRTGPAIEIVSPLARHQVTTLPTIQVTFTDSTGFDVTEMDPMPVMITLTRLADDIEIDIEERFIRLTAAADGEILTQSGDIVYTHTDPVVGGAYRIGASVTDVLGNETVATPVEFTVEGVQPTVSIVSPVPGRIVDPRQPLIISVALTGNGDITVTDFQINGNDVEGTLEDNWLSHTLHPPLVDGANSVLQRGSSNTLTVKTIDSEGRTAQGTTSFAVSLDDTAPVISGPSPKGEITRKLGRVTARVTDNESNITRIQFAIDDNPLQDLSFSSGRTVNVGGGTEVQGQTNFNFFDAPLGTHTVTIVAESTGGSTTLTWEFTIVNPDNTPPQVVTYSPLGIIRTDRPVLAATVSDESGFARNGITLILAGVPGNQGSGRRSSPTSTTVTFTPSISVTPGPYTARLTVIDRYNNRTEAEWQFTVELDETPPSITTSSPHGIIRSDRPAITVSASDEMSGVASYEITVKEDSNNLPVNGVTTERTDKTAATFTPSQPLREGTYSVEAKVTDAAGNLAASKWQFTVELDTIPPTILITRPSQEHTENRRPVISATYTDNLSGIDVSSVKLTLDGTTVEPDEVSETQVIFTPKFDLTFDQHTVTLEVSDTAKTPNTATQEWTFYVERIGIADARNYPNPFDHETTIAFRVSRQAKITVRIYDFTGRLVAQPITNSLREAGLVEVDWHGETSAGEHLARGVYFCHILMESELEPQSAILKMAIVSE